MGLGLKEGILRIATCHNRHFNKLELSADFCAPGYIVVLAAYINHHQITEANCTLPHDGYMRAIGMQMALWGKDTYEQDRVNIGRNYSLVTALKSVEAIDTATASINSCIRQLTFPRRNPLPDGISQLTNVVGELHDNVWSHGRSTGFSFALKSAVPNTNKQEYYLEFALADCGIGFLRELKRAGIQGINTHKDAIEWCIKEGNSSKHANLQDGWAQQLPSDIIGGSVFGGSVPVKEKENNHQGLGLAHLMKLVKTYNGRLLLATGDVCLEATGEEVSYDRLDVSWLGVAISCRFNISDLTSNHKNDDDLQLLEIIKKLGG